MINVFEPYISEDDIESVSSVLRSNWLGKGLVTEQFESRFATFIGCSKEQVASVNSCTQAAFILAEFLAPERNIVILPSMSFVGVANAFASCGYELQFVDVSRSTLNVEFEDIENLVLTYGDRAVLVLNHFLAGSETISQIAALCEVNNTVLIEDAAGVLGAQKNGQSLGTFGDFGIWSFDAMKTITCGDGGMIFSKNPELVLGLVRQAYLGLITESGYKNSAVSSNSKWWEFQISGPHSRSIMNDIAASLGLSQLERIQETLAKRELIAKQYYETFSECGLNITPYKKDFIDKAANYIFPVLIDERRDQLATFLKEHQIYTTFRYFPLTEVEYYAKKVSRNFPVTNYVKNSLLLLPIHPKLTTEEISLISGLVKEFLDG